MPFKRLLPLTEIIAAVMGTDQLYSKNIWAQYDRFIGKFGNELELLLSADEERIKTVSNEKTAKLIIDSREGRAVVNPGYDGVYGKLSLETAKAEKKRNPQISLSSFIN